MTAKEELKPILLKLIEEGRLKEAAELALETLWAPLLRLTEESARAISELRASIQDLKARSMLRGGALGQRVSRGLLWANRID